MFQYSARVIRVVDGDTLWLNVDLGFRVHAEINVRLARINAPETVNMGAEGIVDPAKKFIEENLPPGTVCVVQISKLEKYGRWLAEIYYQPGVVEWKDIMLKARRLNDELLSAGLVKPYPAG